MVAMKRRSPLTLVVTGRKQRRPRPGCVLLLRPEPLDGLVGPPARLQQVVDAPLGVGAAEIGVVAAPGAAGHREDEDPLVAVHEGGGLGEVGGSGPGTEREAGAPGVDHAEYAAGSAGYLGDGIMPEVPHDLVQRRGDGRKGGELLDQRVAPLQRFLADHRVAVLVEDGGARAGCPRRPRRSSCSCTGNACFEEIEDVFPRASGRSRGRPTRRAGISAMRRSISASPVETSWMTAERPCSRSRLDGAEGGGALHGGEQVAEEALLGSLEGGHGGGLGAAVPRAVLVFDPGGLERFPGCSGE